ncbi:MAG: hypothetical protein ACRC7S_17055 [Cetobacterium sp.]
MLKLTFKYIENENIATSIGYQNHKCHWNSYNNFMVSENPVYATVCISPNDKTAFIHFINKDKDNGHYYDITLGSLNIIYYYQYLIGECDLSRTEIENMDDKLIELKYWLIDKSFKNKYIRKFYKWLEDKYNII